MYTKKTHRDWYPSVMKSNIRCKVHIPNTCSFCLKFPRINFSVFLYNPIIVIERKKMIKIENCGQLIYTISII